MDFSSLKVGDLVFIESRGRKQLVPVKRITKRMIITENYRFNIRTGSLYNYSVLWDDCKITIPSTEEINKFRNDLQCEKLRTLIKENIAHCNDLEKLGKIFLSCKL